MAVFIIVGSIGLLIVVGSLVFGEVFEGLFDALEIDTGSGLFSAPVIGAFLAAFGFGATLIMSGSRAGAVVGALGGFVAGAVFATIAYAMVRGLMQMRTDEPVRLSDTVGKRAVVVTTIPEGGLGEVTLVHAGQRMKLNARSETAVPAGTAVVVVSVTSPTSVLVEPEDEFWGITPEGGSLSS